MNQFDFEKQTSRLVEIFGADKIGPAYIREAFRMFRDLSLEEFRQVITLAIERSNYSPRLSALRSYQLEVRKVSPKTATSTKECCPTCAPTRIPGHLMRYIKCHGMGYQEIYPCPDCNPNPVNAIEPGDCYGIREPIDKDEFEMLNKDF